MAHQNSRDPLHQARQALQLGDLLLARERVNTLLRRTPRHPEANHLLGTIELMRGDGQAALAPLGLALDANPDSGALLDHLGLAHLMCGQHAQAEPLLRRAAATPGAPPDVGMRLGLALFHLHKTNEAIPVFESVLRADPGNVDGHVNLARALHAAGRAGDALRTLEAALRIAPRHADVLFNLGVLAMQSGAWDAAARHFRAAIAAAPGHAEAWSNLGVVLEQQQDIDAALDAYLRAAQAEPRSPDIGTNVAHALALKGRHEESRLRYLSVLRVAPDFLRAHEGLAAACLRLGRYPEAIVALQLVTARQADNVGAWTALAGARFETGDAAQCEACARTALALDPLRADAWSHVAVAQGVRGDIASMITTLQAGFARTGDEGLLGMLVFQYRQVCDWEQWRGAWAKLAPRVEQSGALGSPFWLLCEPISSAQQLAYTRAWAKKRYHGITPLPPAAPAAGRTDPRIRVGYLSADFQEHPAAYLIAEVLELHDRQRFEIHAYSHGPRDSSAMRQRIQQAVEHFTDIGMETDDAAARRIRADGIDILIDIKGYTMGDRITIMALRPAPVQVTWLGYPGTTGADFVDYLIADPHVVPQGAEATCSEKVLRLPHCYQPNDRQRVIANTRSRGDYGLPAEGVVFCCFNQTYKFTPDVFAVWMRLLGRVPDSVLWLAAGNELANANLRREARRQGVDETRLIFAPRMPYAEHLARYHAATLALDTFPYTSHTTQSDALWAGCPAVGFFDERISDTFAARVSCGILNAAGLPELICHTLEEYEALALRLASDGAALAAVRGKIAQARDHSPLFDTRRFTRNLEALFEHMAVHSP